MAVDDVGAARRQDETAERGQPLLFRRVELWVVLLVALLSLLGAVGFGWLVKGYATAKNPQGALPEAVLAVASVPDTLKTLIQNKDPRGANRWERFGDRGGWTVPAGAASLAADGYLLLSRFSGDEDRSIVELVDLADFKARHVWRPDVDALLDGVPRVSEVTDFERWTPRLFDVVHPLLLDNGDLIVKDHQSPLARVDRCGKLIWREAEDLAHHSTMLDAEGDIWVPTVVDPGNPDYGPHFFEDGIAELSQDGEVLYHASLPDILMRAGYEALMFTSGDYSDDVLHLNDIEPALADGPYWKKGDLFLSLRHVSMVLQYRPSTDQVIWAKQGPWLAQHDVDIVDDHRIAVFNNNAYDRGKGWYVKGANDVTFYDFATGQASSPFGRALAGAEAKTLTEGLFDLTTEGNLIVEEENSGRILIFAADGTELAEFINRASNGNVYDLGWSRYVSRADGDRALAALAAAGPCG